MRTIVTMARETFSQAIRMRIAVAFIVVLACALGALPFVMSGDGTLAGEIQTFLSYSLGLSGVLLGLVVILVSARIVSRDIDDRTIFLLAVKPMARWQYLLGRWLGMVLLITVLLAIAACASYFTSSQMRTKPAISALDRQAVEMEIFTARDSVRPEPLPIRELIEARIAQIKKRGQYAEVVEQLRLSPRNREQVSGERLLYSTLAEDLAKQAESIGPGQSMGWTFKDVRVTDHETRGPGTVERVNLDRGMVRIAAPRWLLGRVINQGRLDVDGITGQVVGIFQGKMDVRFTRSDCQRAEVQAMAEGRTVSLLIHPSLQFQYQVQALGDLPEGQNSVFHVLEFRNGEGKRIAIIEAEAPLRIETTVTIPAYEELKSGEVTVVYHNVARRPLPGQMPLPPVAVQVQFKDLSLLYRVGSFGGNFVRATLELYAQLIVLAALGVFLGSLLSFPVAAVTALVLIIGGGMVSFISDQVTWGDPGVGRALGLGVIWTMNVAMPELSLLSPGEALVDGMNIPWMQIVRRWGVGVGVRTSVYLLIACLLFSRRELARVQA